MPWELELKHDARHYSGEPLSQNQQWIICAYLASHLLDLENTGSGGDPILKHAKVEANKMYPL